MAFEVALKPILIFLGFVGAGLGSVFVISRINKESIVEQKSNSDSSNCKNRENCVIKEDAFLRSLRAWD